MIVVSPDSSVNVASTDRTSRSGGGSATVDGSVANVNVPVSVNVPGYGPAAGPAAVNEAVPAAQWIVVTRIWCKSGFAFELAPKFSPLRFGGSVIAACAGAAHSASMRPNRALGRERGRMRAFQGL